MTFAILPELRSRLILLFMPLVFALSACTTVTIPYAPNCFKDMVSEEMRKDTPHAPLPTEETVGAWIDQAQKERGQTNKANARANTITHIGDTCDRWMKEAKDKATRKSLIKRIFG